MALGGKREAAGYHCVFVWKKMPKKVVEEVCLLAINRSQDLHLWIYFNIFLIIQLLFILSQLSERSLIWNLKVKQITVETKRCIISNAYIIRWLHCAISMPQSNTHHFDWCLRALHLWRILWVLVVTTKSDTKSLISGWFAFDSLSEAGWNENMVRGDGGESLCEQCTWLYCWSKTGNQSSFLRDIYWALLYSNIYLIQIACKDTVTWLKEIYLIESCIGFAFLSFEFEQLGRCHATISRRFGKHGLFTGKKFHSVLASRIFKLPTILRK